MMQRDAGIVLLVGGEPRIAIPVAASFRRRGLRVLSAVLRPEERAVPSRALRDSVVLSALAPEGGKLEDALLSLVGKERVGSVLPLSDSALALVGRCYADLPAGTKPLTPPPEVVNQVLDKAITLAIAERIGIPVPHSYDVASLEALHRQRDRIRFPVIAKPRDSRNGGDFQLRYFPEFDRLAAAFARDHRFGCRHLIQEYVHGVGIGLGILMHDDVALAVFQHRRLKEFPSTGGVSVLAVAEAPQPELAEMSVRLLRELRWEGVAMVEYRGQPGEDDAAGAACAASLMEVNGRLWGTASLALHAGLDLPFASWQLAHGEMPQMPSYRAGTRWRWSAGYIHRWHDLARASNSGLPGRPSLAADLLASIGDFRPSVPSAFAPAGEWAPSKVEVLVVLGHTCRSVLRSAVSRVLPATLRRSIRIWRDLDRDARKEYARRRVVQALGWRRNAGPRPGSSWNRIMFVCHGNIIRSAFAEAVLRSELARMGIESIQVRSSGTNASARREADVRAVALAAEFGVQLDQHRASCVTHDSVEASDVVLAMDFVNEAKLRAAFPSAWRKVLLMPRAPGERGSAEIPDPYVGTSDDVRACFQVIQLRVKHLAAQLARNLSTASRRVP